MANLSNINNKFLVTTTGEVLIGGTAAIGAAKLQVTGEARVYTGSNLGYWGVDAGNSYVYLGTNSSAYGLSLQTGGIDRVNINDAGNVFISTPITNAFYGLSLTYNNTNTADFTVNQATGQIKIGGTAAGYFPTFYSAGTERMRIDSSGGVSITPTTSTSFFYGADGTNSYINFETNNIDATVQLYAGYSSGGYFAIGTKNSGGTLSEKMRIDSNGDVGIGETNVDARLHISALASNGISNVKLESPGASKWAFGIPAGQTYFALDDVNDNLTTPRLVVLKTSGNVGIGTSSPAANLNVVGPGDANDPVVAIDVTNSSAFNHGLEIFDANLTAGETVLMAIGKAGSTKNTAIFGYIHDADAGNNNLATIGFWGADNKMTVSAGGNVGIGTGTTTPSKNLEVAGSYKLGTNAYIQYDAGYPYTINMLNTAAVGNLILNAGAGSSGFESKIELQGSNTVGAAGITLSTASSTRMVVTADGKIGLGKTDPFYPVDATSFGANTHEWGSGLALFGQDRYSIRELNNLFYSADSRVGGIGTSSNLVNTMFDGNFDTGHSIAANTTYVVEMDGSGIWNMTYPNGYATISFYYIYTNFTSIVGEMYHYAGTYAGQWRAMGTAVDIRGSAGSTRVVRINSAGNNYVSKWRFTFVTGSTNIIITDIAFYGTRTAGAPVSTYMRGDRTNEWTRTIRFRNNANGIVGSINPGNTSTTFNTTSDYRLKEDLRDFKGLDMISKIPVYDFRWINSEKRSYGVLAHELNEVYPEAVEGKKDAEENQCVDYSKIVPLLVKSIQELKAEIELLKSK